MQFLKDLQLIYDEITKREQYLNSYYEYAKGKEHNEAKLLVENFLDYINLPLKNESIFASLNYLINLSEDSLINFMENMGLNKTQIEAKLELAYEFNAKVYLERFEKLIVWIEENRLLTPFYRVIINGVHSIGEVMTKWQNKWRAYIINNINKELFELFNGDEDKIFQMLEKQNLLDYKNGEIADRCYSVLVNENGKYRRLSYYEAFTNETKEIKERLELLIDTLNSLEDNIFYQKNKWIAYFIAIKKALTNTDVDNLVNLWADVDREWMKITTPLQVGHPLEYYEDKYRKTVALEWDLRIINPTLQQQSLTKNSIKIAAKDIANKIGLKAQKILIKNLLQIDNCMLFISKPMLYYGAELNGLFSAQVVPNDEEVSSKYGKKIFAYLDFVRESKKNRPIMQIAIDTFGYDFIKKQKDLINNTPDIWNKIYEISTIGHEFGHILWIDKNSEVKMNKSGQFKNIEEFKATSGGIIAFFKDEKEHLIKPFIDELVYRTVSLMAFREIEEVAAYYCEGLIHLDMLYNSRLIEFNNNMVKINYNNYKDLKELYYKTYLRLVNLYLDKKDAKEFLYKYVIKKNKIYLPINENIFDFVEKYYINYKKIGNKIAKEFIY